MKKYTLLILPVMMITVGQSLAKFGARQFNQDNQIINVFIISGYFLLVCRGLIWIFILREIKLSVAYPFISITYILILAISHCLFDEPITPQKIIGALFLIGGIFCIGLGEFKRERRRP